MNFTEISYFIGYSKGKITKNDSLHLMATPCSVDHIVFSGAETVSPYESCDSRPYNQENALQISDCNIVTESKY